jgi:hypothetical protein
MGYITEGAMIERRWMSGDSRHALEVPPDGWDATLLLYIAAKRTCIGVLLSPKR